MKNMLLASAAVPALIYALPSQAQEQECTAAPDCATLGYTKTASQCEGKIFTRCPFDDTKYNCQDGALKCMSMGYSTQKTRCTDTFIPCPFEPTLGMCLAPQHAVGDLKYSWKTANHDGWLLCNGQTFDKNNYPDLYSLLGKNTVPSYSGYFLKGAASTSVSTFKTSQAAGLPNITGKVGLQGPEYSYSGDISGAFSISPKGDNYGKGHTKGANSVYINFDASKSNSIYGKSTTVTPQNYSANIFIYAGKAKDVCVAAGYQSTTTGYYNCTTITVSGKTCYKNCKSVAIRDQCRSQYTSTVYSNASGYWFPDNTCYDVYVTDCERSNVTNYTSSELSTVCQAYADDIIKTCTTDDSCMSASFSINSTPISGSSSGGSSGGSSSGGSTSGDPCASVTCEAGKTCVGGVCYKS